MIWASLLILSAVRQLAEASLFSATLQTATSLKPCEAIDTEVFLSGRPIPGEGPPDFQDSQVNTVMPPRDPLKKQILLYTQL